MKRLAKGGNAEIFAWDEGHVIKLFRQGLTRQAAEVELQHSRAACAAGIPTPHAEELIEIEGRHGIVFEYCEGPTLYELVVRREQSAERLAQLFFDLQHSIHGRRDTPLPPLGTRLASKIRNALGVPETVKDAALEQIGRLPQSNATCHGDFHPVNVIMTTRGPVIVDWLDAGRGPVAADFARSRLLLEYARPGQVEDETRAEFLAAYAKCCDASPVAAWDAVAQWLLPVAVARLAEPVSDIERRSLVELIGRIVAAKAGRPPSA